MTASENRAVAQRLYSEVINQERYDMIDEIFAPEVVVHDPFMGRVQGAEAFRQLLGLFNGAFPHHRAEVHAIIAEGDYVAVLHTHSGRHGGEFMGLPPTEREVRVGGVEWMRMRDGKIVEFWRHDDDAGILMQLGLLQPAAAGS